MSLRQVFRFILFGFWIFPLVYILVRFGSEVSFDAQEVFWAFKNTFLQSAMSSGFIFIFGLLGAFGLFWLEQWKLPLLSKFFEIYFILPSFLPPIFVILSCLKFLDPFPMGIFGIVFVHVVMNSGFAALTFYRLIQQKMNPLLVLAQIDGVGFFRFLRSVLLPHLKKDFIVIALSFFSLCFASFSVPMLVGGGSGTTIEVLIYEKIKIEGAWGEATLLAIFQMILLFALYPYWKKTKDEVISNRNLRSDFSLVRWELGLFPVFIMNFMVYFYLFNNFIIGYQQVLNTTGLLDSIPQSLFGTILIGIGTGSGIYLFCLLVVFVLPSRLFQQFLNRYVSPTGSLVGFAFLMVGSQWPHLTLIKIIIVLILAMSTYLLKIFILPSYNKLVEQVQIARSMGASWSKITAQVVYPQMASQIGFVSGLGAFWSVGDFAISKIIAEKSVSLAHLIEALMSHYRMNAATVLSNLLLLIGIILFLLFWGIGHVSSSQSR